jgi:hypothetical protein
MSAISMHLLEIYYANARLNQTGKFIFPCRKGTISRKHLIFECWTGAKQLFYGRSDVRTSIYTQRLSFQPKRHAADETTRP